MPTNQSIAKYKFNRFNDINNGMQNTWYWEMMDPWINEVYWGDYNDGVVWTPDFVRRNDFVFSVRPDITNPASPASPSGSFGSTGGGGNNPILPITAEGGLGRGAGGYLANFNSNYNRNWHNIGSDQGGEVYVDNPNSSALGMAVVQGPNPNFYGYDAGDKPWQWPFLGVLGAHTNNPAGGGSSTAFYDQAGPIDMYATIDYQGSSNGTDNMWDNGGTVESTDTNGNRVLQINSPTGDNTISSGRFGTSWNGTIYDAASGEHSSYPNIGGWGSDEGFTTRWGADQEYVKQEIWLRHAAGFWVDAFAIAHPNPSALRCQPGDIFTFRVWAKRQSGDGNPKCRISLNAVPASGQIEWTNSLDGETCYFPSRVLNTTVAAARESNNPGKAIRGYSSVYYDETITNADGWKELSITMAADTNMVSAIVPQIHVHKGTGTYGAIRFANPGLWQRDVSIRDETRFGHTYGNGHNDWAPKGFWIGTGQNGGYSCGNNDWNAAGSTTSIQIDGVNSLNCLGYPQVAGSGYLNAWLIADVHVTSLDYVVARIEVTQNNANNEEGFIVQVESYDLGNGSGTITGEYVNDGAGWHIGSNRLKVGLWQSNVENHGLWYYDGDTYTANNWNLENNGNFNRVEIYRTGTNGGDATKYIGIRNFTIVPRHENETSFNGMFNVNTRAQSRYASDTEMRTFLQDYNLKVVTGSANTNNGMDISSSIFLPDLSASAEYARNLGKKWIPPLNYVEQAENLKNNLGGINYVISNSIAISGSYYAASNEWRFSSSLHHSSSYKTGSQNTTGARLYQWPINRLI